MKTYRLTVTPLTAFGSRLAGDTLFGQLCWAVRNRYGEARLSELLQGYPQGRPFAVVSDALPAGYLPRPALPGRYFAEVAELDRKAAKKRAWLPLEKAASTPVAQWLNHCKTPAEIPGAAPEQHPQPHNTLNRETGTTGTGQFAPYTMNQYWYGRKSTVGSDNCLAIPASLNLYVLLDESRLSPSDLNQLLADIGAFGFGRDASIGLGKFAVDGVVPFELPSQKDADAFLTLAPCAPQGLAFDADRSFYQPFTRFGRHGDIAVHLGNPFKTPVLLAQTGAVFSPHRGERARAPFFVGQGLGGDGSLSKTIPATVHQGYAQTVGIRLPQREAA